MLPDVVFLVNKDYQYPGESTGGICPDPDQTLGQPGCNSLNRSVPGGYCEAQCRVRQANLGLERMRTMVPINDEGDEEWTPSAPRRVGRRNPVAVPSVLASYKKPHRHPIRLTRTQNGAGTCPNQRFVQFSSPTPVVYRSEHVYLTSLSLRLGSRMDSVPGVKSAFIAQPHSGTVGHFGRTIVQIDRMRRIRL